MNFDNSNTSAPSWTREPSAGGTGAAYDTAAVKLSDQEMRKSFRCLFIRGTKKIT